MDGKGAAILQDKMATLGKGASLGKAEHFERHVPDEPRGHRAGEISKMRLGHLVREGFVGDSGAPYGIEAAVEIGQGLDGLAGTGGRQSEAQAKRRDNTLAATTRRLCATGVEQGFGKHPVERVSHHAPWSVIHRGLLSVSPKQPA